MVSLSIKFYKVASKPNSTKLKEHNIIHNHYHHTRMFDLTYFL
jgi:hypothetical protein